MNLYYGYLFNMVVFTVAAPLSGNLLSRRLVIKTRETYVG